jgi:hypothetical protein
MYAGYHPLKRAFDAGKMTYGWQTYAWSGGMQDSRMHLYQYHNGVTVCGISADWDESKKSDFAQWPRPSSSQPPTESIPESSAYIAAAIKWHDGKKFYAYVDGKGRICMNGGLVDPTAKNPVMSGCGLDISEDGVKTISYTNADGKICIYEQNQGSNEWRWDCLDWTGK